MATQKLFRFMLLFAVGPALAIAVNMHPAAGQTDPQACASHLPDIPDTADAQANAEALKTHFQVEFNKRPTPELKSRKESFFSCVALRADAGIESGRNRRSIALGLLNFLGTRADWKAAGSEPKAKLIARSLELKAAETLDVDLIRAIDTALFQSADDISAALRPKTEDYPAFVAEKRDRLEEAIDSKRYDNGPYEVYVNQLLALAYEESYFLPVEKSGPTGDPALLESAVESYWRALNRLDDPTVFETERQRKYFRNDFLFRRALNLVLLGRLDQARSDLRQIINSGRPWEFGTFMDHVYVEKYFRLPVRLVLVPRKTGGTELNVKDEILVNRFFNPTQIALYLCSLLPAGQADPPSYQDIERQLRDFNNHDYRLYLSSSKDIGRLEKLQAKLQQMLDALGKDNLAQINAAMDADEPIDFATAFEEGQKNCIPPGDGTLAERGIFKMFDWSVRGTWEDGKREGKTSGIYVGGYLSYSQAVRLSELLAKHLGMKQKPFAARPTVEG